MRPIILILVLFLSSLCLPSWTQEKQIPVPYTLADRDRTIRIETKIETIEAKMGALETKMDVKFDALIARLDHLIWMSGVIVALLLFMIGYMIWVRKTNLRLVLNKATGADQLSESLIKYLREY